MAQTTAVYVRVSTEDQAKGLESQEKAIRDYLEGRGIHDVTWFRDRQSGKSLNRPEFKRLQKEIFQGRVHTVIVWSLDRISRDTLHGLTVLHDWLERKQIRFVSITEQFDFAGEIGELIASVLFAFAKMQRRKLVANTKRGLMNAKAKGVKLGKRPKLFATDIVPLLEQGLSLTDVAKRLRKSRQGVYTALQREGVDLASLKK